MIKNAMYTQYTWVYFFELDRKLMKTEAKIWLECSDQMEAISEQILAPEEINKYKRTELWSVIEVEH